MGIKTKIEWCDSTINPIMGCTGCALRKDHCYAATLCTRHAGRKGWPQSFDHPEFFPGRLEKAVRWRDLTGKKRPDKPWLDGYPRVIFANDLSDGFCPDVDPGVWLSPLLSQMAASPHIWLLLTKWPDRMAEFFDQHHVPDNFWFGTSITNQKDADERTPWLLSIRRAPVLFVSLEPLLEGIDVRRFLTPLDWVDSTQGARVRRARPALSWTICGGETGHGARPMHPQWLRSLRNQCQAAAVPFLFKSWGAWMGVDFDMNQPPLRDGLKFWRASSGFSIETNKAPQVDFGDGHGAVRIGKKLAGRRLDGKGHNEMPTVTTPQGL